MRRGYILLVPLLLALAAAGCRDQGPSLLIFPTAGPGSPARVTYQAEDGLVIVADFYAPLEGKPAPVVLLLHQFNGSRAQWADLIPDMLRWGYAVLAPDLRSFGESRVIVRGGSAQDYRLSGLDDLALDVAAAIEYLKTRSEVDAEAIGVVGASMGANLAYFASGTFPEVKATVSMSPNASPLGGALLGTDVPNFSPRSVLFMSDEAEAPDARELADNVAEPVEVLVYKGEIAHGVRLLNNPQVKPDIQDWLAANLPVPAPATPTP